jgi:D-serine deaminase-like pyridoxal phosphate-dependent protein
VSLGDLPTPAALVDLDRLQANCRWMSRRFAGRGVSLRPHVKTHKVPAIARMQVEGHSGGVTVSTLAEARAFAAAGFEDLCWALPLPPSRIDEALDLARGIRLSLLVEHPRTAELLERSARRRGQRVSVRLEVDCGYGRTGVLPSAPSSLALARQLSDSDWLELEGLLSHAGHAYGARGAAAISAIADQETRVTVGFAEALRAQGVPVRVVSTGSTPTCRRGEHFEGVTEVRPGNYALFDLHQAAIGACELDEIALEVLATVIGVYSDRVVLDAGALALSKDPGASHAGLRGYGLVMDLQRRELPLELSSLSQEHGIATGDPGGLEPGDRVRILPNHSCLVTALHPELVGHRGGRVEARWQPVRGW